VKGQIVAHGSVNSLRGLIKRSEITCVSVVPAEIIALWPGVDKAWRDEGRLRVLTSDVEPVLRRLLAQDASLCDLEIKRAAWPRPSSRLRGGCLMTDLAQAASSASIPMPPSRVARVYMLEAKYEALARLRTPAGNITTLFIRFSSIRCLVSSSINRVTVLKRAGNIPYLQRL